MSIFSRRGQMNPPEDLDQGYDHGYYQHTDRRDERDERDDDRFEERYDRRDNDRYDERYDDRYDSRRNDEFSSRPSVNREPAKRGVYEEDDAPGYVERVRDVDYGHRPQRPAAPARPKNKGTQYYTPETCQDGREDMVCDLADSHAVVINMVRLDGKNMIRLMDYVMGAVQALGADIRRLEGNCILLTPAGVEVSDDEIEIPEVEDYEDEAYDDAVDYEEDGELYDEVGEEA